VTINIPALSIMVDGEEPVTVKVRQSDLARLERVTGKAISDISFGVETILMLGHIAAKRIGLPVDPDFDRFMDTVEVLPVEDVETPKG
jgi:hypothetical protein